MSQMFTLYKCNYKCKITKIFDKIEVILSLININFLDF